jgi:tetratricopeptide (TPR) repeat protein
LRPFPPWLPLLVVAAAWLAHGRVLQQSWTFDDRAVVREHEVVEQGPRGALRAFGDVRWGGEVEPNAWRPLALASFAVESVFWRRSDGTLNPFGFHLTNLFLHGLCAVLVLLVAVRLAPGRTAFLAGTALLFAVHPLHAGTVSALVGRADLLALLFSLLAVRLWFSATDGAAAFWPLVALCYFLALLSKEAAIGLPVALLILDGGVLRAGPATALRKHALGYALLLPALAAWFVLRPAGTTSAVGGWTPFLLGLEGMGRGALGFVLPVDTVRDRIAGSGTWGEIEPAVPAAVIGGLLLLAAIAALLARRRHRQWALPALGLGWLAAMALPAAWAGTHGAAIEARFAYVTAAGLFLFGGLAFEALVGPLTAGVATARRGLGVAGAVVLLLGMGALTWTEAAAWQDDETYHRALLDRNPRSLRLMVRLGRRLREEGERELQRASTLPSNEPAHRRLIFDARHHLNEAEGMLGAATQRPDGRRDPQAWREYGAILDVRAKAPEARAALEFALSIEPLAQRGLDALTAPQRQALADSYVRLARTQEATGGLREAAESYRIASLYTPDDVDVLRRAGVALVRAERYAEGEALLLRALELAPNTKAFEEITRELTSVREAARRVANAYVQRGRAAESEGDYREALAQFEGALEADPMQLTALERVIYYKGVYFGQYRVARGLLDDADALLRDLGIGSEDRQARRFRELRRLIDEQEREEDEEEREETRDGD